MADQEDQVLVPVSMLRKVIRMTGNRQARKILIEHLAEKEKAAKVKKKAKSTKKS